MRVNFIIIFREEKFGGIWFDTHTMSYRFTEGLSDNDAREVGRRIPMMAAHGRCDIVSSPIQVYIELTRECNLRCRHCFTNAANERGAGLSTEKWLGALDEMSSTGVINARFTGGEPTLRDDWYEILSRSKKLGFAVSLQTNGTYDDAEDVVKKIAGLELDQVTVSLDGIGATHDALRGSGSFEKLLRTMKLMKAAGVRLRFNTILTKNNAAEMPAIFDLVSEYGVAINLFYMRSIGRGADNLKISLDFEEHARSAAAVRELWKNYPGIHVSHSGFYSPKLMAHNVKFPRITYPYGNVAISIASDGTYWPHHYSIYQGENFKLGEYPKDRLIDIWAGSKKLDGFRKWLSLLLERCEKCFEHGGRCSGINFEMEIEKISGRSPANPFCVNPEPAAEPWEYLED